MPKAAPAPAVEAAAKSAGTTVSELRGTTVPFTSLQTAVARNMLESLKVGTQLKPVLHRTSQKFRASSVTGLTALRGCAQYLCGLGWQAMTSLASINICIKMSQ